MRTAILGAACILTVFSLAAETPRGLSEVTVTARRPMREIGAEKTTFDSLALRDNIAQSMADVLAHNSSVFVKNYGRATLSTVAFRGTSPSHTQVTWNGMQINSPMLGMTDFSMIPAFFVDKASLLHGPSSVNDAGGGLGGLVRLATERRAEPGLTIKYTQGIGSYRTSDEFARISYADSAWSTSTRAALSSSKNDYTYINHDKKEPIYDSDGALSGWRHPRERNRSGAFRDFHVMHQTSWQSRHGDYVGISAWWLDSDRELPLLTVDYGDPADFENKQRERTLRAVAQWQHQREKWNLTARAGYVYTHMAYDYRRETAPGIWSDMTRSRSNLNTIFGNAECEWRPHSAWLFGASASLHQYMVKSRDKDVIQVTGNRAIVGYDKALADISALLSARWQPMDRIGISALMRGELNGDKWVPPIPALLIDGIVWPEANLTLRGSATRNYRFPSLNDRWFLPGGNPDLKPESGWSYDAGASFSLLSHPVYTLSGSAGWFDSRIDDWIIWLPTVKGFFTPKNVKSVHAYGVEIKGDLGLNLPRGWHIDLDGSYSWTPSVNVGEPMSDADRSVGCQIPYVPRHSAAVNGRLSWRGWAFDYKWNWYSRRYTMSSNDLTISGSLPEYFMSCISLEKGWQIRRVELQVKIAINNLFNEDYISVLSRPMPGINGELFLSFTWH